MHMIEGNFKSEADEQLKTKSKLINLHYYITVKAIYLHSKYLTVNFIIS